MIPNLLKDQLYQENMFRKMGFLIVCIFLTVVQPELEVGVTNGLERVFLHDPVPEGKEIFIKTARNEYEPFQIVVKSDLTTNITVNIPDLSDENGNVFSGENFTLYEVQYIYVKEPSPRSGSEPGWYPDGLKPLDVFTVKKDVNTIISVDVYTPEDQTPGEYTGVIEIEGSIEIPLCIEVWNFTLPRKTSLKSGVEVMVEYVIEAHDLNWEPEVLEPVLYTYYQTLIEHRVMPWELYFAEPEVFKDGSIDMGGNHNHMKYFMDTLQANCLMYPLYGDWPFRDPFGKNLDRTTVYLRSLYEYYTENGWEDRFFFHLIDEPNSRRAYEEVRDMSRKLEKIHPDIKFMVTEQMIPDDPSWGDLYNYVDIWCPLFPYIEDEKEFIRGRQALKEKVWTYTALTQGERNTPFWELDFPVLNYRVVPWMIWNSDISGLIYWACNWWGGSDPWEDPETWKDDGEVYNGEGVLVYPGEDGCTPSIRLKALREGMEDYEYFVLLKSLGKGSFIDGQVKKIVKSWYKWEKDPEQLLEVRTILGEEINRLSEELGEESERESPEEKKEEKEEKESLVEKEEKVEKRDIIIDERNSTEEDYWLTPATLLLGSLIIILLILAIHFRRK